MGAIGLMQVMPATGKELNVGDITVADSNVHAGTKYMDQLVSRELAGAKMDDVNRTLFAFAAYNCGPGNMAKLRKTAEAARPRPERLVQQRRDHHGREDRDRDDAVRAEHLQVLRGLQADGRRRTRLRRPHASRSRSSRTGHNLTHGYPPTAVRCRPLDIFARFTHSQSFGSALLLAATVAALVLANSRWAEIYFGLLSTKVGLAWGDATFALSVQHWINDLLMVVFFFVVGLEIKRELVAGQLSSVKKAARARRGGRGRDGGAGAPLRVVQPGRRGGRGMGHPDGHRHRVRARRAGGLRRRACRSASRCS